MSLQHSYHNHIMSDPKPSRPLSKRVSTAPAAPKPPATIDPSAILANHATLTGSYPITVGSNAVLHPYCKIISNAGPVEVGEGSVLWERSVVGINTDGGIREEDGEDADFGSKFVMLERNVIVESGAQVAAKLIGEGTVVEAFATVGDGCVIGKVCILYTQKSDCHLWYLSSNVLCSSMPVLQDLAARQYTTQCCDRRLHDRLWSGEASEGYHYHPESDRP
jgi:carbonic anhydrase/acetyltransferase-like protein (isoleucine patch superfamily)